MWFRLLAILAMVSALTGTVQAQTSTILAGSGATFPDPLYQLWIEAYEEQTGDRVTYKPVGSGDGIRGLLDRKFDFGGTDAFLNDKEMENAPAPILHIPTCLGAVVVTYDLPGEPTLQFTAEVLAEIFLGRITNWSDRRLRRINPDVSLPDQDINVVHRSDGSGTTFIFTDYLTRISPTWEKQVGRGKKVRWPVGMGVDGNENVAQLIKDIPGSIGYVELTFARQKDMPTATLQNSNGHYVEPDLRNVSLAAEVELPEDMRVTITNTSRPTGYPISSFTYLIVYQEQDYGHRTVEDARALARFLWWATHEGQKQASGTYYAPLPRAAVTRAESLIRSITFDGEPVVDW